MREGGKEGGGEGGGREVVGIDKMRGVLEDGGKRQGRGGVGGARRWSLFVMIGQVREEMEEDGRGK